MPESPTIVIDDQKWPSIESAYAFVLPSYQWMISRYEAADSRIQTMLTFVATVSFGVPALVRASRPDIPLESPLLLGAFGTGLLIAAIGIWARVQGSLILPDPAKLFEKWLGMPVREFQKNSLYFAGENFETNRRAVGRKATAVAGMAGLFAAQLALMLAWVTCA